MCSLPLRFFPINSIQAFTLEEFIDFSGGETGDDPVQMELGDERRKRRRWREEGFGVSDE